MREKLIELLSDYFAIGDSYHYTLNRVKEAFAIGTMGLDDFEEYSDETVEEIADYLIAHGVTIAENRIGTPVWGIWEVTGYKRNGKKRNMKVQVTTTLHLTRALESGSVEIREKVCTKSDLTFMGKTVFKTREEAEIAIRRVNENNKGVRP